MNLYAKLCERAAQGRALRLGLIGAGKFGSMYCAQVPKTPGVHLVGIADFAPATHGPISPASAGRPSALWKLTQPVAAGEVVRWTDVAVDEANSAGRVRREIEQMCAAQPDMMVT